MSVNVEVSKTGNESSLATIRKFSRKVQGTGLVKTVRNRRYYARSTSKIVKKKRALKLIKRRAEYRQLVKEGKVSETPVRRGSYARQNQTMTSSGNSSATGRQGEAPIAH